MPASSLEIGVAASAGAAFLLSTGTILQALGARQVDSAHGLRFSLLTRLLHRPRWIAGTVIGYSAFPFQLVALAHAPLVLVQPMQACGLLLLLGAGARLLEEHVHLPELAGALAIAAGLGIATWGAPSGQDPAVSQAALAGAVAGLLVPAFAPYAIGVRCGRLPLILAAGLGFAAANMAVQGHQRGHRRA